MPLAGALKERVMERDANAGVLFMIIIGADEHDLALISDPAPRDRHVGCPTRDIDGAVLEAGDR